MTYSTISVPAGFTPVLFVKRPFLEKEAVFPLALIPLIVKMGLGALTAHGLYSGTKNIVKGNYGAGAFDIGTSLPFIGWAGKGLKAGGMVARILARGGKVGSLGKRFANMSRTAAQSSKYKDVVAKAMKIKGASRPYAEGLGVRVLESMAKTPAAPVATTIFGKAMASAGNAYGKATGSMSRGYQWLGKGGTSTPMTNPSFLQKGLMQGSKSLNTAGKGLQRVEHRIGQNWLGGHMQGNAGMAAMIGGPMVYQSMTGKSLYDDDDVAPATKYHFPIQIAQQAPAMFGQMPNGFQMGNMPQS